MKERKQERETDPRCGVGWRLKKRDKGDKKGKEKNETCFILK